MGHTYQALPSLLPSVSARDQPPGSLSLDHTQHQWPSKLRQGPWEGSPLLLSAADLTASTHLLFPSKF